MEDLSLLLQQCGVSHGLEVMPESCLLFSQVVGPHLLLVTLGLFANKDTNEK